MGWQKLSSLRQLAYAAQGQVYKAGLEASLAQEPATVITTITEGQVGWLGCWGAAQIGTAPPAPGAGGHLPPPAHVPLV